MADDKYERAEMYYASDRWEDALDELNKLLKSKNVSASQKNKAGELYTKIVTLKKKLAEIRDRDQSNQSKVAEQEYNNVDELLKTYKAIRKKTGEERIKHEKPFLEKGANVAEYIYEMLPKDITTKEGRSYSAIYDALTGGDSSEPKTGQQRLYQRRRSLNKIPSKFLALLGAGTTNLGEGLYDTLKTILAGGGATVGAIGGGIENLAKKYNFTPKDIWEAAKLEYYNPKNREKSRTLLKNLKLLGERSPAEKKQISQAEKEQFLNVLREAIQNRQKEINELKGQW